MNRERERERESVTRKEPSGHDRKRDWWQWLCCLTIVIWHEMKEKDIFYKDQMFASHTPFFDNKRKMYIWNTFEEHCRMKVKEKWIFWKEDFKNIGKIVSYFLLNLSSLLSNTSYHILPSGYYYFAHAAAYVAEKE